MGNAVGPGTERAAAVVVSQTAPEIEMNILAQVLALAGVSFISSGKAVEGGAIVADDLLVELVLFDVSAHIKIVSLFAGF